jgi:D-alanine-D-alanine ligase
MTSKKINVGILFGGKSAEHEVSLRSAKNIFDAIDKAKYNPILIGIDKVGQWHLTDQKVFQLTSVNPHSPQTVASDSVALVPQSGGKMAHFAKGESRDSIDVVFPILHGPFGEDGTVQGLLKLANIPFVGSSVLGSAVGMDKDVMKRLLRDAGLKIGKFICLQSEDPIPSYANVTKQVGNPCFIKPANMGSSVGVSKVSNEAEFKKAIKDAFQYDNKVLVEEFIKGREIECSVLGNAHPIASVPGEIIPTHDFYSYEAKYIDEKGAKLEIPAKLSPDLVKKVQDAAIRTFKALTCEGLGRVDSFLTDKGEVVVNEINTMPGFTKISMYPKLWEASGIGYTELIDRLIQLAIERFQKEQRLRTSYTA